MHEIAFVGTNYKFGDVDRSLLGSTFGTICQRQSFSSVCHTLQLLILRELYSINRTRNIRNAFNCLFLLFLASFFFFSYFFNLC